MSFAYMALYTGDYLRDTRHLTPLKHGVYLLLLMHCWDQRGPLPTDEQECAGIANCRSADEVEALRYVLKRYFVRMDDGMYNMRIQREIERANSISNKRQHAAFKRHSGRQSVNDANAMQLQSKSNALDTNTIPIPISIPITTPTPKVKNNSAKSAEKPADVDTKIWNDYIAIRKAKRAPLTNTALTGIQREAEKAGLNLEHALRICCERGWQGFKADWIMRDRNQINEPSKTAQAIELLERMKSTNLGATWEVDHDV